VEYPLRVAAFASVHSLSLFVVSRFSFSLSLSLSLSVHSHLIDFWGRAGYYRTNLWVMMYREYITLGLKAMYDRLSKLSTHYLTYPPLWMKEVVLDFHGQRQGRARSSIRSVRILRHLTVAGFGDTPVQRERALGVFTSKILVLMLTQRTSNQGDAGLPTHGHNDTTLVLPAFL